MQRNNMFIKFPRRNRRSLSMLTHDGWRGERNEMTTKKERFGKSEKLASVNVRCCVKTDATRKAANMPVNKF